MPNRFRKVALTLAWLAVLAIGSGAGWKPGSAAVVFDFF
jgi:hypothetical protein